MIQKRSLALLSATGLLVVSGLGIATLNGSAAQSASLPVISYDNDMLAPAGPVQPAVAVVAPTLASATPDQPAATVKAAETIDSAELECMAKIVHHEAGNQPREGQIAVAQTLLHRMKSGKFGGSICEVANQPGQFFDTTSYRPSRDSDSWVSAVDVSRAVLRGDEDDDVAPGAMYFRASSRRANSFFRTRQRVGAIGDHIFYR